MWIMWRDERTCRPLCVECYANYVATSIFVMTHIQSCLLNVPSAKPLGLTWEGPGSRHHGPRARHKIGCASRVSVRRGRSGAHHGACTRGPREYSGGARSHTQRTVRKRRAGLAAFYTGGRCIANADVSRTLVQACMARAGRHLRRRRQWVRAERSPNAADK